MFKKIVSLLIISIFFSLNFWTNSFAWNDLVTKSEKTKIDIFVKKYVAKVSTKYSQEKVINKFVNIIKKIDILKANFQKRNNITNKEKILQILWIIKVEMKTYLAGLKSSELNDNMKEKLKEIGIIKSNLADSIFLENWVEVYKHWNRDLWNKNVIYYIRLLNNDLNDLDSDRNEVYLKKAIFIPGVWGKAWKFKKNSNTFVAKLGTFTNSDLYDLKEDFQNVPNCYNPFKEYEWTKYYGIADSLLYVSDSYEELIKKIKLMKKKTTMLNLWWNMCPKAGEVNKMRWLKFETNQWITDFLQKDLKSALNKLK